MAYILSRDELKSESDFPDSDVQIDFSASEVENLIEALSYYSQYGTADDRRKSVSVSFLCTELRNQLNETKKSN